MISARSTRREALMLAAQALAQADIDDARLEARALLMAALHCDLTALILHESEPLGAAAEHVRALLARRIAHEPLSRILQRREFFGLDFSLNTATLDPRPDTEVLVEAALAAFANHATASAPYLLDIGTGSGAILLALLHALPGARGIGLDIAPEALAAARENADQLGLAARAQFLAGDLFSPLAEGQRFDAILSNPPYIPSADLAGLEPEVRLFDPPRALDGGADGLDFYRRIIAGASDFLVPGGLLAFEVGMGQAGDVEDLMRTAGFEHVARRLDLSGIERVVLARRPAGR